MNEEVHLSLKMTKSSVRDDQVDVVFEYSVRIGVEDSVRCRRFPSRLSRQKHLPKFQSSLAGSWGTFHQREIS